MASPANKGTVLRLTWDQGQELLTCCRNRIFEAMFQLLNVPHSTLQQRGLDHSQFISLLTKCLVKATKYLAERIQAQTLCD